MHTLTHIRERSAQKPPATRAHADLGNRHRRETRARVIKSNHCCRSLARPSIRQTLAQNNKCAHFHPAHPSIRPHPPPPPSRIKFAQQTGNGCESVVCSRKSMLLHLFLLIAVQWGGCWRSALVGGRSVRLLLLLLAADRLHVVAARQQQVGAARHGRSRRRVRVRDGRSGGDRCVLLRRVHRSRRVLRCRRVLRWGTVRRRRVGGARTDGDDGGHEEGNGRLHGWRSSVAICETVEVE